MTDYQKNSHKSKGVVGPLDKVEKPEKHIERVVTSEVVVRKKTLGEKARDAVANADLSGVVRYVAFEVLVPAARNMVVEASIKGVQRMMYGDTHAPGRQRIGSGHTQYHTPVRREHTSSRMSAPARYTSPRSSQSENFLISSRSEAESVLDMMNDIVSQFEVVSLADLKEMLGHPITHVDNTWGWSSIRTARVRQTREGYLLDLPPMIEI